LQVYVTPVVSIYGICSFLFIDLPGDQCPNVKYERDGYFVTVDIEKGISKFTYKGFKN